MAATNRLAAALRQLLDEDIVRLRAASASSPNVVPGLLAYLDYAGDWEQHRRRGVVLDMQGPMAALDDGEVESALTALQVLSARFTASGNYAAASLFDAIAHAIRPPGSPRPDHSLH